MNALQFHHHGPPEQVLQLQNIPAPPLGPNQVRVRLRLAPVNPSDRNYIRGTYGKSPDTFPAIPGFEGMGQVVESRGLLGKLIQGKRVSVLADRQGTWAEEVVVDAKRAIAVPDEVPDEQAAVYFVNPATAYLLTQRVHPLHRGEWLLQTGASSQVGRMVVRLGRHFGFRTLNIVRSAESAEELKRLGADACLIHDATRDSFEDLSNAASTALAGAPVRYGIDCIGGPLGSRVLRLLSSGGRLVVYGTMSDAPLEIPSRVLMTADRSLAGFWLGPWMARASLLTKLGIIRKLRSLHLAGLFRSEIAGTFPFAEVALAIARAEASSQGKILLSPS